MIMKKHDARFAGKKAYDQGFKARKEKDPFCPYRVGTKAREEWMKGFKGEEK